MSETIDQPQQTSTASCDDPIAMRLPDETWLEVLEQLDYRGLKKVERVCKRMQRLVKDKHLDTLLFRQKPSKPLQRGDKVELHPLIGMVDAVFTSKEEAPILVYSDDVDTLNALGYQACDDFATQPACTSLKLDVLVGPSFTAKNESGVSCRDVFEAVANFWESKPPRDLAEQAAIWEGCKPDQIGWHIMLGDHNGWRKWTLPKVRRDGSVQIQATGYDS
ncbi:hypothetical protein JCM10213_007836 [Rhodosporidiobolus nylandii]